MRRQRSRLTGVALALCLGGALTACGGGDGDGEGYAAVGAGATPQGPQGPPGKVTLVPLDSPSARGTTSGTSSPSPPPEAGGEPSDDDRDVRTNPGTGASTQPGAGTAPAPGAPATPDRPDTPGTTPPGTPGPEAPRPGPPKPGTTTPPPAPRPTPPAPPPAPAALTLSAPVRADADTRWCERVTVTFRNTGGTPARTGTVTFATHIIGSLGVDWATIHTTQPLPGPLAAGASRTQTYTVCVDSWRVPLGMHVDTRKVTATWT
ncbi:hypothetical protein [Streptomyces sp. NPDC008121]|uniref:hypothetical protein n=1 Tax=Streptomyces sp. NPDC008121 TaxID=3364809 RepID=UPI0036EB0266